MKKVVLASAAIAALLLSGCSSKTPEVDMSADANQNMGNMGSSDNMMSDRKFSRVASILRNVTRQAAPRARRSASCREIGRASCRERV